VRTDLHSRTKVATTQEIKDEIARREAADEQRKRDIEECTRKIDVYDPVCRYRLMRDRLIRERAEEAGQLHNLRYELKCSRSLNDADNTEWRPASSVYTYGDDG
jgi:hypothetical protein